MRGYLATTQPIKGSGIGPPNDMSNDGHALYLCVLQRRAGRRAGDVLSRFLVELQLCQQGLLALPDQMLPLLFFQLPLPPQLVLLLTVVVVEHLAPGAEIDVLLPQDVDQLHVLGKRAGSQLRGSRAAPRRAAPAAREGRAALERGRKGTPWSVAAAPATPCPSVSVR